MRGERDRERQRETERDRERQTETETETETENYDSSLRHCRYVVTELLEGGELLYQLEGNQEHGALYTEDDARRITKQILEGKGRETERQRDREKER